MTGSTRKDLNKAILRGVVVDQPETREWDDGSRSVNLRIRTTAPGSDESGDGRENSILHSVQVSGRQRAEAAERLAPDDAVWVEGEIRTREYVQEGEERVFTAIRADVLHQLDDGEPNLNRSLLLGVVENDPRSGDLHERGEMLLQVSTLADWRRRTGEEVVETHEVRVGRDLVDDLDLDIARGTRVFVEGSLERWKVEDAEGAERWVAGTRADSVLVVGAGEAGLDGESGVETGGSHLGGEADRVEEASKPWDGGGRRPEAPRAFSEKSEGMSEGAPGGLVDGGMPASGVNTEDEEDEVPF